MAIATTRVQLLASDWTDLGIGPLEVQANGAPVLLSIADSKPPAGDPGFSVTSAAPSILQTASHVWARATGGSTESGSITVAPAVASGGGGASGGAIAIADGADAAQGTTTDAVGANTVLGQLKGILVKLGAIGIGAGTAVIGKIGLDQSTPGASNGVVVNAGENHLGEVAGNSAVAVATLTRPANTTGYASGQLVANATTAAAVTPISLPVARKAGGTGRIARVRLAKSSTSLANASFRIHLYKVQPTTIGNGDGGAWLTNESTYLGAFDVTMDKVFTDGAKGMGFSNVGAYVTFDALAGSQNIYALVEARAAYAPASGEVFTLALEIDRD